MDGSTYQHHSARPIKVHHTKSSAVVHPLVFWIGEQPWPARLLQVLLIKAGIEQNPGPTWICSVCDNPIRANTTSVKCNNCDKWCHLRRCTNLTSHREWSSDFKGLCCLNNNNNNNNPSQAHQRATQQPQNQSQGQQQKQDHPTALRVMQFNCNGLTNKIDEITNFMRKKDILVAAIQETKLTIRSNLKTKDEFSVVRCDRATGAGGGLAFIIHETIPYRIIKLDGPHAGDAHVEQQGVMLKSGNTELLLINIYIPPQSSCTTGYRPSIEHLMNKHDCLIMGDFNAHHPLWHSNLCPDQRGEDIASLVNDSDLCILNEPVATRVTANTKSSPDITLISDTFISSTVWKVETALNSDHLPIIINIGRTIERINAARKTFVNFNKADWESFTEFLEQRFRSARPIRNVFTGEKYFRQLLQKALKRFVPAGRIPKIRPNFPSSAALLADERDSIRISNPADPRIADMNKKIHQLVNEHKRDKWEKHLSEATFNKGPRNLWKTLSALTRPNTIPKNNIISFEDVPAKSLHQCVNNFNRQFTEHPSNYEPSIRNTLRRFNRLKRADFNMVADNVSAVIGKMKASKALGPDGISTIMLKKLGQAGIEFLTTLINLSINTLRIPSFWKTARIIPLIKPGKPADDAKSYRPISLLSPIAKTIEALLLPEINNAFVLAQHQHGFRKNHSTTTALHVIHEQISQGLNETRPCSRTVLVALDLSKAFDTVSHAQLLKDVLQSNLSNVIKRWTKNYLYGRQTFVEFRNGTSRRRRMKQGVPQGSIISPTLFNMYMSQLPTPPAGITMVSYADDCTVLATGTNIERLCSSVNEYLEVLHDWFKTRNLQLSQAKSSATLFTSWTKEVNTVLDIRVASHSIPTIKDPKILGVYFDNMLTFNRHASAITTKIRSRNNALKAIAGSTWGKDKETLNTTYKAISRPIANYAAPIWSPQLSNSHWTKLQSCQNAALRTATGCHLMTCEDHLHTETKILPIRQHNDLLSKQYVLACHKSDHPNANLMRTTPPPRCIRRSTQMLIPTIQAHITTQPMDTASYKKGLRDIHTLAVANALAGMKPNKVLNTQPPAVNSEEMNLPRKVRSRLAQLRSGYSTLLNDYNSRIDPTIENKCPKCSTGPHNTQHLFSCTMTPTELTVVALWTKPILAAKFLNLEDEGE